MGIGGGYAKSRGRGSLSPGMPWDLPGNPGIFPGFLEEYCNMRNLPPVLEELFFSKRRQLVNGSSLGRQYGHSPVGPMIFYCRSWDTLPYVLGLLTVGPRTFGGRLRDFFRRLPDGGNPQLQILRFYPEPKFAVMACKGYFTMPVSGNCGIICGQSRKYNRSKNE